MLPRHGAKLVDKDHLSCSWSEVFNSSHLDTTVAGMCLERRDRARPGMNPAVCLAVALPGSTSSLQGERSSGVRNRAAVAPDGRGHFRVPRPAPVPDQFQTIRAGFPGPAAAPCPGALEDLFFRFPLFRCSRCPRSLGPASVRDSSVDGSRSGLHASKNKKPEPIEGLRKLGRPGCPRTAGPCPER